MERTVTLRRGKKAVVVPETATEDGLLEELIASIKSTYSRYKDQLEHVVQCRQLLAEAIAGGEFSAPELEELQRGVDRQAASAQPLIDQLAEQITLAQKAWRRKKAAIDSVASLLGAKQLDEWNSRHEKLADELDSLVQKLS